MDTWLRLVSICGGIGAVVGLAHRLRQRVKREPPMTWEEEYDARQW